MSEPGLPKKSRENLVYKLFNSISGIWKSTEIKNVELDNTSTDSKTLDDVNLPIANEIVPLPSSESNGGDQMANKEIESVILEGKQRKKPLTSTGVKEYGDEDVQSVLGDFDPKYSSAPEKLVVPNESRIGQPYDEQVEFSLLKDSSCMGHYYISQVHVGFIKHTSQGLHESNISLFIAISGTPSQIYVQTRPTTAYRRKSTSQISKIQNYIAPARPATTNVVSELSK
jgi:hypothetical protein